MSSQTTHHPRTPPHTHNRHAEAPHTVIIQSQPQHQQHPFRAPRRGDSYNYTHRPHDMQPESECSATQIGQDWGINKLSGDPHTSEFLENTGNCWPVGPLKILTKIFSALWYLGAAGCFPKGNYRYGSAFAPMASPPTFYPRQ